MRTNAGFKFPDFLIGMGVGAIAGLLFAPRPGEETREYLRERTNKGLDALSRHAGKLRESTEGAVAKGKTFMGCQVNDSAETTTEGENQAYQEERRENLGG